MRRFISLCLAAFLVAALVAIFKIIARQSIDPSYAVIIWTYSLSISGMIQDTIAAVGYTSFGICIGHFFTRDT